LVLVDRFLSIVRRLIHGEEKNERVYQTLYLAFNFLENERDLNQNHLFLLETVVVARILLALGYFEPKADYSEILLENEITLNDLSNAELHKKELLFDINSALKETHL
jgi:hypothetical protein